ncbi:hypothetical protein [Tumebacillus permanentifrigoris]|uniref:PH (Pleckstrin Homology) domain-containing protein n=1 Tax=Tumebacillus permanentifrigoris TaxID=378543 RepID=A0A316DT10_9BACL|nr:hypothetical protein [Tumebacillus permanentifrigoris]PWK09669.1 hypothetical protein C7459_113105 [Tumebacillus permanentifrigoris]
MTRTFRIRDPQRYLFLSLLFPLVPMTLAIIQPAWTFNLIVLITFFLVLMFRTVLRTREFAVGDQHLRIDRGRFQQRYHHEEIYEFFLVKNNALVIRLEQRNRVIRLHVDDYAAALRALEEFSRRHAIPLTDRRPRARVEYWR